MTSYNAKDCVVTFDDEFITGFGESMITGEKDEELFSTTVGAQGDVCVSEINNDLGTVTLTLQPTSPSLKRLVEAAKAGKTAPLRVNNKKLGTSMGGTKARIKNLPSVNFGAEAEDTEIEFQVFDYTVS